MFLIKIAALLSTYAVVNSNGNDCQGFRQLIERKTFVDKTLLIKEYVENETDIYVYVTAPPGFGKSVNLQMMKHFFEIQVDSSNGREVEKSESDNYRLFEDLKIRKEHRSFFNQWFGRHPVIYVDYAPLANVSNVDETLTCCRAIMRKTFEEHKYLLLAEDALAGNKNRFRSYIDNSYENIEIDEAIRFLCGLLYDHFKTGVVILIDEYDAFARHMLFGGLHNATEQVSDLFDKIYRRMFSTVDDHVFKVVLAGSLNVNKASPEFALIDKRYRDMYFLHDHYFSRYYGLSTDQVRDIVSRRTDKIEVDQIRDFYNGYRIREQQRSDMYNIRSVMKHFENNEEKNRSAVAATIARDRDDFEPFGKYLRLPHVSIMFMKLLNPIGTDIVVREHLQFTESLIAWLASQLLSEKLTANSTDVMLSLMLQFGYLSYEVDELGKVGNGTRSRVQLKIPNIEVSRKIESVVYSADRSRLKLDEENLRLLNDVINEFSSEDDGGKLLFEKLYNKLQNFLGLTKVTVNNEKDFRTGLTAIFKSEFHENVTVDAKGTITLLNKNETEFLLVLSWRNKIEKRKQLEVCTDEAMYRINASSSTDGAEEKLAKLTVRLGICVGVLSGDFKTSQRKIIGMSYWTGASTNANVQEGTSRIIKTDVFPTQSEKKKENTSKNKARKKKKTKKGAKSERP